MFFQNAYIQSQRGIGSGFAAEPGLGSSFVTSFMGNLVAPLDVHDDEFNDEFGIGEDKEHFAEGEFVSKGKGISRADEYDDEIEVGSAERYSYEA